MIAVIGDIIKSKSISDRQKTQQDLRAMLGLVNQRHEALLASRFTITLGDEFQGVFKESTELLHVLDEITFSLKPINFRFGIGIGRLTTELDPATSIGADGPAYWKAREAIEFVHKNNDYGRANIHLCVQDADETVVLINEILKLTALQVSGWRDSQIEVYKTIMEENILNPDEINHQQIAERLDILTSSLTRRLESSGIKRYMLARREVELALNRINKRYA
ncbi:MAG TPA: DNA-binding protein [Anaerolineaceae bacterium]|nr:DNA-binding protein [Anaerolineaceae bacterium]